MKERYLDIFERIREIPGEELVQEPFRGFFRKEADYLLTLDGFVRAFEKENILTTEKTLELKDWNVRLYEELLPERYEHSFVNPAFSVSKLGLEYGPLFSALSSELHRLVLDAYEKNYELLTRSAELFVEVYCLFSSAWERTDEAGNAVLPKPEAVRETLYDYFSDYSGDFLLQAMAEEYCPEMPERIREERASWKITAPELPLRKAVLLQADFGNTDYLYRTGEYVSDEVLKTAEFILSLPESVIDQMAFTWYKGFKDGFFAENKPYFSKSVCELRLVPGFERVGRRTAEYFAEDHYDFTIPGAPMHLPVIPPNPTDAYHVPVNLQAEYDHTYDLALMMGSRIVTRLLEERRKLFVELGEDVARYAGPVVMEHFGEPEFHPAEKKECLRFTEHQAACYGQYRNSCQLMTHEFILEEARSFTIIAWPLPTIGPDFRNIFEETLRINTLDTEKYGRIQQKLIDALDQAEYVEVLGGTNRTNMRVMLNPLSDPSKESNFENCLADVNIPLGEVFTSPRLTGTEGILNVNRVYIKGTRFNNLTLQFRDGRVVDYSCDDPDGEEAGKRTIRRVIFEEKDHLPLGEFAIGTNTAAYSMAEKYGIGAKMPILIAEKTGPHFAVGDTCYSFMEDMELKNPDGKCLVAKDNEVTELRKQDPSKAYFAVHTDITIRYNELGSITAVRKDGRRIPILDNGRFVLPGTEALNEALDQK